MFPLYFIDIVPVFFIYLILSFIHSFSILELKFSSMKLITSPISGVNSSIENDPLRLTYVGELYRLDKIADIFLVKSTRFSFELFNMVL